MMHFFKVLLILLIASTAHAGVVIDALKLNGQMIQGGMVIGQAEPGSKVWFNDRELSVSSEGIFVFGFDRDAGPSAVLKVTDTLGKTIKRTMTVKKRSYKIQRIEGIAKRIMSPAEEDLRRIRSEAAMVSKARAGDLDRLDFTRPFVWPLKGPISGVYGSQRYYNGEPRRPHYGVDVAAPTGTPVSTPASGIVTVAYDDMFYSGGTVIIDHGRGISSTLMHLSKVHVNVGDEVEPGDVIAEVGAGGRATGPHLDWRMNWFGERIDPTLLVDVMPPDQSLEIVVNPEVLLELNIQWPR